MADEGSAAAADRLAELAAFRADLRASWRSPQDAAQTRWPQVFGPLAVEARAWNLPQPPLLDLLDAFEQDVRYTHEGRLYANTAELLDYSRRSANPVGRLLLHLYGVNDDLSVRQSDAICTALQLINFWQDLSVDLPRRRYYLPQDMLLAHGVALDSLTPDHDAPSARQLMAGLCDQARALMRTGAPLALRLPGRAGWELRLVVQGGLRILDKLARHQHRCWQTRPRLSVLDGPLLLWRAWRMPSTAYPAPQESAQTPHQRNPQSPP